MATVPPADVERAWRRGRTAGLLLLTAVLITVAVSIGVRWRPDDARSTHYAAGRAALEREDWATAQRALSEAGAFANAPALLRESYLGEARQAIAEQRWGDAAAALLALDLVSVVRDPAVVALIEAHPAVRVAMGQAQASLAWRGSLIQIAALRTRWRLNDMAFSPDGRRLFTATGAGSAGNIEIWDLATLQRVQLLTSWNDVGNGPYGLSAFHVEISPDGTRLVSSHTSAKNQPPTLALWRLGESEPRFTIPGQLARFSPDGELLAGADSDGQLALWRAADGAALTTPNLQGVRAIDVVWNDDGGSLSVIGANRELLRWEVARQQTPVSLGSVEGMVGFSSAGGPVATASGRTLTFLDPQSLAPRRVVAAAGDIVALAVSPDGQLIATGANVALRDTGELLLSGRVEIWDVRDGRRVATIDDLGQQLAQLRFSPDGRTLVAGDDTSGMTFWRPAATERPAVPPAQP